MLIVNFQEDIEKQYPQLRVWPKRRPVAIGWHEVANATSRQQDPDLLQPPGIFLAIFYGCFILVDKERSPGNFVHLNVGLCNILETSTFSCKHIAHLFVIA